MFSQKIKINPKGSVKISIGDLVKYDDHNAILDNSKEIIARVLGGQGSYSIDLIKVYKNNVLVAQNPPSVIDFPEVGKCRFFCIFNPASFDDTIDEVRLSSVAGGDFSAITGLSITKGNTENMSIQWTIEIV